ncbi:MAG: globin domain-containing protein [Cyclobacteriaceae bacterium]|nr:globin domain-containing protein [Flammeovirgaceae bacterium]
MKNLTSSQVEALKKSLRQLETERLAAEFYETLFKRYPQVKAMFPTDMKELGIKLMSVFELVIYSFEEKSHNQFSLQDTLVRPMQELGKQHEAKGVLPEHYTIANDLLLEILVKQNKNTFTEEVEKSWELALQHLTVAMLSRNKERASATTTDSTLRDTFHSIMKKVIGK